METTEINWRQNCLTGGVHDGRPDAIWNVPLLYAATVLFKKESLEQLVISRIYNDAMQLVEASPFVQHGTDETVTFTEKWANRVQENAEQFYMSTLQHKVGELFNYYREVRFEEEMFEAARRNKEGKLNWHYEPLHSHDTINMFCRILGVKSEMKTARENNN